MGGVGGYMEVYQIATHPIMITEQLQHLSWAKAPRPAF